jgi:hypothetical protein
MGKKLQMDKKLMKFKKLKRKLIHEEMKSRKTKVTLNVGVRMCEVGTNVVRASILQGRN